MEEMNNTEHNLANVEMDWEVTPSIRSNKKQPAASLKESPVAKRQKTSSQVSAEHGFMPKPSLEPSLPHDQDEHIDATLKPQYRWNDPASSSRHLEPAGLMKQPKRRDMEADPEIRAEYMTECEHGG